MKFTADSINNKNSLFSFSFSSCYHSRLSPVLVFIFGCGPRLLCGSIYIWGSPPQANEKGIKPSLTSPTQTCISLHDKKNSNKIREDGL